MAQGFAFGLGLWTLCLGQAFQLHHTKIELEKQYGIGKEMSCEVTNLKTLSTNLKRERSKFEKELISTKKENEKNESEFIIELNKARVIIENKVKEIEEASSANENLKENYFTPKQLPPAKQITILISLTR